MNPTQPVMRPARRLAPVIKAAIAGLAGVWLLSSCSSPAPMIRSTPVAATRPVVKPSDPVNPVIFIHGTMGSRLQDADSGRVIWGDFSKRAANGTSEEAIRGMALPMRRGQPLSRLKDRVRAVGNLDSIHLVLLGAMPLNVPVYGDTGERFRDIDCGGGRQGSGRQLDFYYDWRRSCDENARLFAAFVSDRKADLIRHHGFPRDVKFNVVAHSQGGLLLEYYLRFGGMLLPADGSVPVVTWAGAPDIEKVVLLAPPHRGVGPTLDYLTSGHKAHALLPKFEAAVVCTLPALYQMMPRACDGVLVDPHSGKALDPLDYDLWVEKRWGLANPDQDETLQLLLPKVATREERRAIALDHLRKCLDKARQFQAAVDQPVAPPAHIETSICAGNTIRTKVGFLATTRHLRHGRSEMGDGTVAVYSALSKARGSREVSFFDVEHLDIATDRKVHQQVLRSFGGAGKSRGRVREIISQIANNS